MTRTYGNLSGNTGDEYPGTPILDLDMAGSVFGYIRNLSETDQITYISIPYVTEDSDNWLAQEDIIAAGDVLEINITTLIYRYVINLKSSTPGNVVPYAIEYCMSTVSGGSGGGATAQEVWEYTARTITGGGLTAQQVWEYATRSLTDKLAFALTSAYDRAKDAASATELSASETAIKAEIAKIPILGDGSKTKVYTVYDSDGSTPLEGVRVTVYTDISMANECVPPVQGTTDILGRVTFQLDPGTYYLKRYKLGKVFANPDTEVVEA